MEHRRLVDAGLVTELVRVAADVFGPNESVLAVYLYGSAARGEPAADLDVAVLLEGERVPPAQLEAMASDLQRLGAPHGPEIDLRVLNGAGPRFCVTVLREGRLLYERHRDRRLSCEARFMSQWADFRPTWERMRQRMIARWAGG
ncbi:MAG: nucleotidyltransferase domain-containing protein [Polyangiales bacterium]